MEMSCFVVVYTKSNNGRKRSHYNDASTYGSTAVCSSRKKVSICCTQVLYYVNHQYILHLYLRCIHRCIHRSLYRSWYLQAASHSSLSLLLQYKTALITDNRSRHYDQVLNFQNDYFAVIQSQITNKEKKRASYKLKPCTRFTQGHSEEMLYHYFSVHNSDQIQLQLPLLLL